MYGAMIVNDQHSPVFLGHQATCSPASSANAPAIAGDRLASPRHWVVVHHDGVLLLGLWVDLHPDFTRQIALRPVTNKA